MRVPQRFAQPPPQFHIISAANHAVLTFISIAFIATAAHAVVSMYTILYSTQYVHYPGASNGAYVVMVSVSESSMCTTLVC